MHLTSTAIEIQGAEIKVLTSEGDPRRTFVLVHGLGVASSYFERLVDELAPHGKLVLLDLPGFGSSKSPDRTLRIAEFATIARTAVRHLGITDAVWIGHSMGVQVVIEAAVQEPGLAPRIVLLGAVVNSRERSTAQVLWRFVQGATHESLPSALASVRAYLSCGPRWFVEIFPIMLRYPLEERIRSVQVETLLISGEKDRMSPPDWIALLAERSGGPARVAVVPGAHQAMHTHAAQVAEIIVGDLAEPVGHALTSDVEAPPLRPSPPRLSRVRAARVAVSDTLIALRDLAASALPSRRNQPDPEPLGTAEESGCASVPIVLLPGILENSRYLNPLARWLAMQGHVVHHLPVLGWNLASLEKSVAKGFQAIEALGLQDAVIVAHSKGGLIGKAMMLDPRSVGVLRGMVAVASPFNGSLLWDRAQRSRFVRPSPLGLFHPDHPELSTLIASRDVHERIVSLAPSFDQMIPGGSHLVGAINETLPVEGHFRVVRDRRCWEIIHRHVDTMPASRPAQPVAG